MSKRRAKLALLFAALGDPTRLALFDRLSREPALSISELSAGAGLTRQGITKHLDVLKRAGLVKANRSGRELLFSRQTNALQPASDYLARASRQWDEALVRLQSIVET